MISGFHNTVKDLKPVCILRRARHLTVQKQDINIQKWMLTYSPGFHSMFADYCSLATASNEAAW